MACRSCLGWSGAEPPAGRIDEGVREKRTALKRLAVAGLGMAQVMTFAFALYAGAAHGIEPQIERYLRLVSMLVTVPVVFYSAVPFFRGAWHDLKARRLGMVKAGEKSYVIEGLSKDR